MHALSSRPMIVSTLLHTLAATCIALCGLAIPSGASATPALPAHDGPAGMTSIDVPGGGRVLVRIGATPSADPLRSALASVDGYFDGRPTVRSAVRSKDGRTSIALFESSIDRHQIRGLIVTSKQSGTNEQAWMFDDPRSLAESLPRMEAQVSAIERSALQSHASAAHTAPDGLRGRWIAAARSARTIALPRTIFPDNTGSIGIATGFTPSGMATGGVTIRSNDGAALRMQGVIGAIDPRGNAMFRGGGIAVAEYSPDVATAWKNARRAALAASGQPPEDLTVETSVALPTSGGKNGAVVDGYAMRAGRHLAYEAIVTVSPPAGSSASWTLVFSVVWSPVERFAEDAPSLLAMEYSYSADMQRANQIQDAAVGAILARSAKETQAGLDSNAAFRERQARNSALALQQSAEAQDYISREGASVVHQLKGEQQVSYGSANASHHTVSLQASGNFVPVPISQYIKGVDY